MMSVKIGNTTIRKFTKDPLKRIKNDAMRKNILKILAYTSRDKAIITKIKNDPSKNLANLDEYSTIEGIERQLDALEKSGQKSGAIMIIENVTVDELLRTRFLLIELI